MKLLPNEDFDPEVYEDEKDWAVEDDPENEQMQQIGRGADKRDASLALVELGEEDGKMKKKGKLNSSALTITV